LSDESLFREVDEEVRREELEGLWKKYGSLIIAACLGVILTVGGIKAWQYWQKQQAEAGGAAFYTAVDLAKQGKLDEAGKAFAGLTKSHAGYGVFGRFKQAALLVEKDDWKAAIALYDQIAADRGLEAVLRDLAKIKAAYLLVDTASLDDIKSRVASFDNDTNAWRSQARELIALAAYRAGDYLLADRKMNETLADYKASDGARQRARIFLSVLAPILDGKKAKSN
jgi:hypothetical protein